MKKILIASVLLFNYSFAIKDFIIKPQKNLSKILYSTSTDTYPLSLNSQIDSDDNNIFQYSGHFRVIYGKDYENDEDIKNLADKILDIANYVWQKEVEDFKFKAPRNTNKYYIDIYIGNTDAYNPEIGDVTIDSDYCGYASAYSDGTPYFVINPDMNENVLKVTIAHEFFHTIQYAYGLDDVDYNIWDKNTWFLEATAVMMEDEVYDDINDYLNYLPYYIDKTNYPIDYSNGMIEYGKVLFAKYIREKYGIEKIRKIFEDYETNETILDDLKKEFNFDELMLGYGKCLVNKDTCFEEGKNYPKVDFYSQSDVSYIGYYGIMFYNEGNSDYLNSINNEYLQEDFNGTLNKRIDINQNGLIVINRREDFMRSDILSKNSYVGANIKKGWNLVSNIFLNDLNLSKIDGVIFWVYRNGSYKAYSNVENLKEAIKKANLGMKNDTIFKNEGFWIYANKDYNLTLNTKDLADNNISSVSGWQIVGYSSSFYPKYINAEIIWEFNDNNWSYYSNNYDLDIPEIEYINPSKGYFILQK